MVALTLMSSTFSLFLMTSGESETTRQQRYRSPPIVPRSCADLDMAMHPSMGSERFALPSTHMLPVRTDLVRIRVRFRSLGAAFAHGYTLEYMLCPVRYCMGDLQLHYVQAAAERGAVRPGNAAAGPAGAAQACPLADAVGGQRAAVRSELYPGIRQPVRALVTHASDLCSRQTTLQRSTLRPAPND